MRGVAHHLRKSRERRLMGSGERYAAAMTSSQTAPPRPGALRLALFESQPLYLAGMRSALESGTGDARVLESPGPFEARADTLRQRPDMVILGMASSRDMLTTLRELRSALP
jgi:hypothetical protein